MSAHVTLRDFYRGHDEGAHAHLLTVALRDNAARIVGIANGVLDRAVAIGINLIPNADFKHMVNSGWRPPAYNAATKGAARFSLHMTCEAIDLSDPTGELDEWLFAGGACFVPKEFGLWMEHPAATKGWCHLQVKPQASFNRTGLRYFYP